MTGQTKDTAGARGKVTGGGSASGGITLGLSGRQLALLGAAHHHGGRWTTQRAMDLYRSRGLGAPQRGTARRDLEELRRRGLLTAHGPENGRWYEVPEGASW